ncbi:P-loop containing nucleoside triphosphate hydrolase protein [Cubamyces lactineus]|nr:P-loop containing nucleoside triphosphate hydrolase protein [Cubamyces lactineus]
MTSNGDSKFGSWFTRKGSGKNRQGEGGDDSRDTHGRKADDYGSETDTNDNDDGHGDLGDSLYARKRRELLKLARSLTDLGASALIDVPRIVVIGAQSTGKSSLVEAVTGINVPRDSGTCTRCPMECTILTTKFRWSCTISLRVTDHGREGEPTLYPFSPKLTAQGDVELWIRRAQAAVLCPHLRRASFTDKSYDELKVIADHNLDPAVLKFTQSVVVIDIEDPRGADLSFVDLPGLVQNEDDDVILMVQNMVKDYIQRESTVILVTLPATEDLENQQALRFAKDADPAGLRTIGVVTKPDGLDAGASGKRDSWLSIFKGDIPKHYLQKGYYCVRLPSDQERRQGVSRQAMERTSTQFFSQTSPWKDIRSSRLGVANLVRDISALLMTIIEQAIPKMREAAAEQLAICLLELGKLPPLLTVDSDATAEVVRCIFQLSESFQQIVLGRSEDKTFVRRCRRIFAFFEKAIRDTAPDFRPVPSLTESNGPVTLRDDFHEAAAIDVDIADELLDDVEFIPTTKKPLTLREVTRVLRETTGWELPHHIPYEAKERLLGYPTENWPSAARACFELIAKDLKGCILKELEKHFGRFPALEQHARQLIVSLLEQHIQRSKDQLKRAAERESTPYGTQNVEYFETMRNRWLAQYKEVRNARTSGAARPSMPGNVYLNTRYEREQAALRALADLGITNLVGNDLYRLISGNFYEDELLVMADVRAYFDIAYKRYADDIPEEIKNTLLIHFAGALQDHLVDGLLRAPDSAQRLEKLVEEDPKIKRERARLQDRRRRLQEINARLNDLRV